MHGGTESSVQGVYSRNWPAAAPVRRGRFLQAAGPAAPARFPRASPSGLASSFSFPRTISPYPCLPKPLPALPGRLTSGRFLACASELLLSQHPRACRGLSARPPFVSLPLPGHSSCLHVNPPEVLKFTASSGL